MGTFYPKPTGGAGEVDIFEQLEDLVRDQLLIGQCKDRPLALLIKLALTEIQEDRPLFPNPLQEPVFYTEFKKWVRGGWAEAVIAEKAVSGTPGSGE